MKKLMFLLFAASLILFGSCKRAISLQEYETTIYHNGNHQIPVPALSHYEFHSNNPFHATVTEKGLVLGKYVGETDIMISNGYDEVAYHVTVAPTIWLYSIPDVNFGESKNSILAKFGTPYEQSSNAFLFANYDDGPCSLMVTFNQNGLVEQYVVLVPYKYFQEIALFLNERYYPLDSYSGKSYYMNALTEDKATLHITAWLYNSNFWFVLYEPFNSSTKLGKSSFQTPASIEKALKSPAF